MAEKAKTDVVSEWGSDREAELPKISKLELRIKKKFIISTYNLIIKVNLNLMQ